MPVLALLLLGWLLVCLVIVALCVAARRDDEALHKADASKPRGLESVGPLRPGRAA